MDMWNWLHDCYDSNCLTIEEMERVMADETAARELWDEWADDSYDFIDFVRKEVQPFLQYIKKKRANE